jgi:hypothetical protein
LAIKIDTIEKPDNLHVLAVLLTRRINRRSCSIRNLRMFKVFDYSFRHFLEFSQMR